jgi:hypothetical protein
MIVPFHRAMRQIWEPVFLFIYPLLYPHPRSPYLQARQLQQVVASKFFMDPPRIIPRKTTAPKNFIGGPI